MVLGDSEPQFTTGTTITSGNQSMITATQITSYLRNPGQSIIKHAASLGLKLKAGSTDDIYAVDFLHMTLLPVTLLNGEVRNVLAPHSGAFTKWAKISSDPRVVTKIKGKQRLEAGVALRVVADAVAKSHAEIPDNFPILGNLLRKFRSLGLDSSAYDIQPGQVIREYNYKPRVTKFTLSSDQRVFALERQAERYDCTIDDLLEVEALIDSVTSLPSFIMHPLLHKMATRDYA